MGLYKRDNTWYIQFNYNGKKIRKSAGTSIKKEAEILLSEIKLRIRNGTYNKPEENKIFLSESIKWYKETYIDQNILTDKNRKQMLMELNRFLDILGDKPVIEFRVKDVEKYKMERLKTGVKKASIDRALGAISGLFTRLARYEMIEFNPLANKIFYFHESCNRERIASPEEIKTILNGIQNIELKLIVLVAVLTGLRLSDILKLSIEHLDLNHGIISIQMSKTKKFNKNKLSIPIHDKLLSVIIQYIKDFKIKNRLFNMTSGQVSNAWRYIMNSMNIADLRFHDLRHTFATYLRSTSADFEMISKLLGHTRLEMTEIYSKTSIELKRKAIQEIEVGYLEI